MSGGGTIEHIFPYWNESVPIVVFKRVANNIKLLNIWIHTIFVSEIIEQ